LHHFDYPQEPWNDFTAKNGKGLFELLIIKRFCCDFASGKFFIILSFTVLVEDLLSPKAYLIILMTLALL